MALTRVLVALCVTYAATMAGIVVALATGFTTVDKVAGPAMVIFGLVAVGFSARAVRNARSDARIRRTWRLVTVALSLALATPVLFLFLTGARPFPQPGDGAHMGFAIMLFAALQSYPLRAATRRERWKAMLDSATVAIGASMLLWYLVIGPAMVNRSASVRLILAAAAYPIVDLLVLFAFARVLMRGTEQSARRPLMMLGTGVLSLFIGDAYLGYTQAQTEVVERTPWQFVCWLTMHLMLACGAVEQCRRSVDPATDTGTRRRSLATKLPYVAIGIGYTLMALATLRQGQMFPWYGLVVGGMAITGVVVARQLLAQNESDEAAATDALTGLANRARLRRGLMSALDRSDRGGRAVGVLLIDLNGFKPINDTLGHQAGDQVLVAVADAMCRSVRDDDVVGRLGGDEFAVVLPSVVGPDAAVAVAQRITEALTVPVVIGGSPVRASASIGVAVCEPGAVNADEILHRADVAMYSAKRSGNPCELWHVDLEDAAADQRVFEAELAAAADADQLRVVYQPIVELATGDIMAVEALVRWEHPKRGTIEPDVFIPIAERTGAIDRIGMWVLAEATARAARWRRELRYPLYLSVNLSPLQLRQPALVAEVRATLSRSGLDPHDLVLELTESALVQENDTIAVLEALREFGIRIAVDDFGTGYSSLRYLARLPVDILKLDRCFVSDLNGGPRGSAVAEAVVRLAHALQLDTVAEGIETSAQAAELTLLGYRTGQGYHIAHPQTAESLTELLSTSRRRENALPAGPPS